MTPDTATQAPEAATPEATTEAASAADTAGPAAPAADVPDDDDEAAAVEMSKVHRLLKLILHAMALGELNSSYSVLQVAAFLIDLACERAGNSHEQGVRTVSSVLLRIKVERDSQTAIVDELVTVLNKARERRPASKESARG
jgi:hypothetical protein